MGGHVAVCVCVCNPSLDCSPIGAEDVFAARCAATTLDGCRPRFFRADRKGLLGLRHFPTCVNGPVRVVDPHVRSSQKTDLWEAKQHGSCYRSMFLVFDKACLGDKATQLRLLQYVPGL